MPRRAWVLMASAVFSATTLPACAPTSQNLLKTTSNDNRPIPVAGPASAVQPNSGVMSGLEESDTTGPQQSGIRASEQWVQLANRNTSDVRLAPLPAGWRLPEYEGPPSVLQPLDWQARAPSDQASLPSLGNPTFVETPISDSSQPQAPEPDAILALRMLLANQSAQAVKCLETYDRPTQELLMRLLPAVALITEKGSVSQLTNAERGALDVQLQGLLVSLHAMSDLTIDKLVLCDLIDRDGRFVPQREGYVYQVGELVQVYLLLRNVASELRDGYYVTVLHGKVSLKDAQGQGWDHDFREWEKPLKTATASFDCYRPYDFYVPHVPPGRYTLTFEVTDETHAPRRVARKSIEFTVAARGSKQ
jgi:hypothetical protein